MSENLTLYDIIRVVPPEAQKEIKGGRLKGKTDINPMWRLKTLTEQFGICGIGWKYTIAKQWLETGANGEISAFVNIELFVKVDDNWSDAIPGTGGSSFVSKETSGYYTSDECYKMALTDAISVACKSLGMGADIYWMADSTKYDEKPQSKTNTPKQPNVPPATAPVVPKPQEPGEAVLKTIGLCSTKEELKQLCETSYLVFVGGKTFNNAVNTRFKQLENESTTV